MSKRIYVGRPRTEISQWEQEIIQLKKEAKTATGDKKENYEVKIKELQAKIDKVAVMPADHVE